MMNAFSWPLKVATLAVLLLSVSVLPGSGIRGQEIGIPAGTTAPSAILEDLEGTSVDLRDFIGKGKPTLVEFWAHWCGQCKLLQPEMERVHETFGDKVSVVAVAVAVSQTPAQVKAHIREHDPGYPYLFDGQGNAVRSYQVPGTAVVLIFDGDGKVVYNGTGGRQDLVGALREVIEG